MKVLVRDRRAGKTTELIKWLLQGKEQDKYPYWSRVIVVPTNRMVPITTRTVFDYTQRENWNPCSQMLPHMHREGISLHEQHFGVLTDVRESVWSLRDLDSNLRGGRDFEYGLDNAEEAMSGTFLSSFLVLPTVITMTGEAVDSLCD